MAYYISKIDTIRQKSKTCVNCGKEHLEKNIIVEKSGIETLLCLDCETLMIVTSRSDNKFALKVREGEKITVRRNMKN